MMTSNEWSRLSPVDQYGYTIYLEGQIQGLIKALHLAIPRNRKTDNVDTNLEPTEFKIISIDEWLANKTLEKETNNDTH